MLRRCSSTCPLLYGHQVACRRRCATTGPPPKNKMSEKTSRNSGSSLQMNNGGSANPNGQGGYALGNQAPPHQVCLGKGVTSSWSPSPPFRCLSRNGATPTAVSC